MNPLKTALIRTGLVVCLAGLSALTHAQSITPGQYIMEGGMGTLEVKSGASQPFTLETVGANAHTCSLAGEIRNGKAVLADAVDAAGKACVVQFQKQGEAVNVDTRTQEACREFCGMRAWFTGLFIKPVPACEAKAQRKTRNAFKQQYDQKDYASAQATLEPLLKQCGPILGPIEAGWIRNDLALTQFKQGDSAACLRTLQPLAEMLSDIDKGVIVLAPSDEDSYRPMLKATRTNLKLCRGR